MSTRANIRIIDGFKQELWFYRHCDGYPEGTLPTLNEFLDLVKSGKIRDNCSQSAGWLILIGAKEYKRSLQTLNDDIIGWEVGSYEPTTKQHGDICYLYTIDLENKKIKVKKI